MLCNILKYAKNLTLTHNFDQLDTALIGSEQIQRFVKQHQDRYSNPSNIAKVLILISLLTMLFHLKVI